MQHNRILTASVTVSLHSQHELFLSNKYQNFIITTSNQISIGLLQLCLENIKTFSTDRWDRMTWTTEHWWTLKSLRAGFWLYRCNSQSRWSPCPLSSGRSERAAWCDLSLWWPGATKTGCQLDDGPRKNKKKTGKLLLSLKFRIDQWRAEKKLSSNDESAEGSKAEKKFHLSIHCTPLIPLQE